MQDNRILSALSYLSVFFAPFIVPIIIFLVSKDLEVRDHSKKAFISHLFPFLSVIATLFLIFGTFFTNNDAVIGSSVFLGFIGVIVVNVVVVIYNIYKAIRLYV